MQRPFRGDRSITPFWKRKGQKATSPNSGEIVSRRTCQFPRESEFRGEFADFNTHA